MSDEQKAASLMGKTVWTYYPVSQTFCWEGTVVAVEGERVLVRHHQFGNLQDRFHVSNVREERKARR